MFEIEQQPRRHTYSCRPAPSSPHATVHDHCTSCIYTVYIARRSIRASITGNWLRAFRSKQHSGSVLAGLVLQESESSNTYADLIHFRRAFPRHIT